MKRIIFKLIFRLFVTGIILLGILIVLVLNPSFLYVHKTEFNNYNIYHNKPVNSNFRFQIDSALEIIKKSEYYDSSIKFDICLNDGSIYPSLLEVFLGKAFALGFTSNKIAICGEMHCDENYVEVNEHKWNLIQLIAHEATHCLVYNRVGFWSSNPVANHPNWKWEGYPEYISRLSSNQNNLIEHIEILNKANTKDKDSWATKLSDGTISSKEYYKFRLLNQYCIEIKKMSFANILKDTTSEQTITHEMNIWSEEQNKTKNY